MKMICLSTVEAPYFSPDELSGAIQKVGTLKNCNFYPPLSLSLYAFVRF